MLNEERSRKLTRDNHFFRFFMPYLFQEIPGIGKNVWLPLNRNYKPLGVISKDWVDYDAFAKTHGVKFAKDPRNLKDIWEHTTEAPDMLWLYSDAPSTRRDYFARLEKLMTYQLPLLGVD
jgi:hypothetical protein